MNCDYVYLILVDFVCLFVCLFYIVRHSLEFYSVVKKKAPLGEKELAFCFSTLMCHRYCFCFAFCANELSLIFIYLCPGSGEVSIVNHHIVASTTVNSGTVSA